MKVGTYMHSVASIIIYAHSHELKCCFRAKCALPLLEFQKFLEVVAHSPSEYLDQCMMMIFLNLVHSPWYSFLVVLLLRVEVPAVALHVVPLHAHVVLRSLFFNTVSF